MLKYNDTNIIVGVIKQLLKEFNLPKIKTLNNNILNHLKNKNLDDSFLTSEEKAVLTVIRANNIRDNDEAAKVNKLFINADTSKIIKINNLDISDVSVYDYNRKYLNITKNLEINNIIYDSYTHKYLGEYLRFLRDYKNLNLMSMYNCFANEVCSNANIIYTVSSSEQVTFSSDDTKYKIYMVPVKFAQNYTLAIDCHSTVQVVAGIMSAGKITKVLDGTYARYSGCEFSSPVLYDKLCYNDYYDTIKGAEQIGLSNTIKNIIPTNSDLSEDDSLYLFVKVPYNCNSSFVVLEGKYFLDSYYENTRRVTSIKYEDKTVKINNPQLLDFNSLSSHPIADRLIEFLLDNVICNTEEISDNIYRIQKTLLNKSRPKKSNSDDNIYYDDNINYLEYIAKPGIWTEKLKNAIIQYYLDYRRTLPNNSFSSYDFVGFVDKDVERLLGK